MIDRPRAGPRARPLPSLVALAIAGLAVVPLIGLTIGITQDTPAADVLLGATSAGPGRALADLLPLAANTLLLAVAVTALSVAGGTALAWLEMRARYPGGRVLAGLALLPLAMPSYLLAGVLRETLGPGGLVGRPLGLPVFTGIGPAIVVLTLVSIPYVHVLAGAALLRMSVAEEEAARGLGSSGWRVFRAIVLPRLRPALALGGLLVLLYVASDFGAVAVLDCPVLTWRMFQAYETQNVARAAVLGLGSLGLIAPFLAAGLLLQRRVAALPGVANPRGAGQSRLRPAAAAAAYGLHAVVIGLGVALPLITLARWVGAGLTHGESFAGLGRPLFQTLLLAGGGGVVVLLLATIPAWVSTRARWTWLIDHAVYVSSALPGILVATGLLIVALAVQRAGWDGVYLGARQACLLLFAGYAMRYLSQGFSGLKEAFLRLDPRHEESAQSLGAGPLRRLRRIVLPAVAPGAAAAYLLLFLVLVKELPITLMLQPIGVQTLSYRVFDRYQEAFLHDAGLAGTVLLGVALAGQLLTLRWRRHA